jgi:hypothetical protein
MPFFTKAVGTDKEGMVRRQCTSEYKLEVVKRTIRQSLLGLSPGARVPADVHITQWIGMSFDEKHRMRVSPHRWLTNQYPLVGWPEQMLARPWTRAMCQQWFADFYPGRTLPRSACIACPMHSNTEWRDMKNERPEEWAEAVEFDAAIRHRDIMDNEMFLHRSCVPLGEVVLSVKTDPKQDNMFAAECLGYCGS